MSIYYAPTKILLEKNAEEEVAKELLLQNATKVLIHYGSTRIEKDGLLDKVTTLLKQSGINYVTLSGVVPNPRLSLVHQGIELGKKEKVDFILAIGGGSVIDSSKAIGYGLFNGGEVWDFYSKKRTPLGCTPIGCILTQAAAGSEMSDSSVITNDEGMLKRGCNSDYCRLKFALLNPELTYSLPPYQTSCAVVDIMMHTMERYFITGTTLPLTDNLALSLIKTVMEYGLLALKEPNNYEARATLMWASSISHNGLMAVGNVNKGDWAPHQLEHELSGLFDVAHGAGLAAIWSSWATYVCKTNPARFQKFGEVLFSLPSNAEPSLAIKKMEDFYLELKMPIRISQMGIKLTEEEIETLSTKCSFNNNRTIGALKVLNKEDIKAIYELAK